MKIRKAEKEDIKQIAKILEQIAKLHYEARPDIFKNIDADTMENRAKETIDSKEKSILVLEENECIKGVVIYKIKEVQNHLNLENSKTLWIEELGVDEESRRRGIGKKLINEIEKIAEESKCNRIELNCWQFNENGIEFYKSCGMNIQRIIMEK